MYREVTIGVNTIPFLSNGVTPLFYKQIFKSDLLKQLNTSGNFELAGDKIPELAFIMAKQAEKADMSKLNYNSYVTWLEQFEPLDLVMHGKEIAEVYISSSIPTEEPKKKAGGKANA